jgi:hypothetical protein
MPMAQVAQTQWIQWFPEGSGSNFKLKKIEKR